MAMGDDRKVEAPEINTKRLGVVSEGLRVVAGIEQDVPPGELDQCGESPILAQVSAPSKRVVEDGYAIGGHFRDLKPPFSAQLRVAAQTAGRFDLQHRPLSFATSLPGGL